MDLRKMKTLPRMPRGARAAAALLLAAASSHVAGQALVNRASWVEDNGCAMWSSGGRKDFGFKWSGTCAQSQADPSIKNSIQGAGVIWRISQHGDGLFIESARYSNYGMADGQPEGVRVAARLNAAGNLPEWRDFTSCGKLDGEFYVTSNTGVRYQPVPCSSVPASFLDEARRLYETTWRQRVAAVYPPALPVERQAEPERPTLARPVAKPEAKPAATT